MRNFLKIFFLILFQVILFQSVNAQKKFTISGAISDSTSGEKLIGATFYEKENLKGTTSNLYGFYSLTLPEGEYEIICSYMGYQSFQRKVLLNKNQELNIKLKSSINLKEFVISAENSEKQYEINRMSSINVDLEKVQSLPVLLGEVDIIKTIQLLPGVQSGSEGSSGLYVRGGGPDQNLILLDGVPIYNASHLFGFFSVFNADAINSVELIKGGFPARYGGRLSSVLDIRMKEGNMNEFHGAGSIGLISSKFSIEGPIIKDKTSFMVSARRTYIDVLAQPFIKMAASDIDNAGYYFYDINAKINHKFNEKSHLYYSFYMGDDKFYMKYTDSYLESGSQYESTMKNHIRWGNIISAVRWNYRITPKLFSNTTVTFSKYRFDILEEYKDKETAGGTVTEESFEAKYLSKINDWSGKIDFDYLPRPNHYIKFGTGYTYHIFDPEAIQLEIQDNVDNLDTTYGSSRGYANEIWAYFEDDIKISKSIKINPGVYLSGFSTNDEFYYSIEPRFNGRLLIGEKSSIKLSYARMTQYLHLLSNPSIGLPTDLWVPTTENIKPEKSHQIALGYSRNLFKKFDLTVEGYYKSMENLIEYEDGASFFGNTENWEGKVVSGKGWSYGGEILLEKRIGKTSGWIGYTLSWTERKFDDVNFGEKYPYRYDRRHDIGIAITHKFNEKVDIGIVWVYGTGNAFSLGLEKFLPYGSVFPEFSNQSVNYIESRNNYRMPAYHRLDIGVNIHKEKKWGEATWNFGIYNVYNRKNPFFLYFDHDVIGNTSLKQISIFPIIPSISYQFKF
jgi:outer membrane cobalamin receptor